MKKLLSAAILAIAFLGFVPSGFCTPKDKPNHSNSKIEKTTKPKKEIKNPSEKEYTKITIIQEIFNNTSLQKKYVGNYLFAPRTVRILDRALANQLHIEVVDLPKIHTIDSNVFYGCRNLKKVILGQNLNKVDPCAFNGCPANLKIIYKNKEYSIPKFFEENNWVIDFKEPQNPPQKPVASAPKLQLVLVYPSKIPGMLSTMFTNPSINTSAFYPFKLNNINNLNNSNIFIRTKCNRSPTERRTVIESSIEE